MSRRTPAKPSAAKVFPTGRTKVGACGLFRSGPSGVSQGVYISNAVSRQQLAPPARPLTGMGEQATVPCLQVALVQRARPGGASWFVLLHGWAGFGRRASWLRWPSGVVGGTFASGCSLEQCLEGRRRRELQAEQRLRRVPRL